MLKVLSHIQYWCCWICPQLSTRWTTTSLRHWSCSTLSLLMLQAGCDPRLKMNTTKSKILLSATGRRSRQLPQLPFRVALTKLRQPLSYVSLAFISTLSDISITSPRPSLLTSPYCVSHKASADPSPDPLSSRWYNVIRLFTTGSRKCNSCRYSAVSAQASPVGNELCCPAGVPLEVGLRRHHSAPSRTSLIEGG